MGISNLSTQLLSEFVGVNGINSTGDGREVDVVFGLEVLDVIGVSCSDTLDTLSTKRIRKCMSSGARG